MAILTLTRNSLELPIVSVHTYVINIFYKWRSVIIICLLRGSLICFLRGSLFESNRQQKVLFSFLLNHFIFDTYVYVKKTTYRKAAFVFPFLVCQKLSGAFINRS